MLLVGLTGGIASGKSAVSKMLADRGAVVLDADLIAREIVEPGEEAYRKIVEHFGTGILSGDLRIDREKLGRIVFSDSAKRALLNELTHPKVMSVIADRLEMLRPTESIVVCDIPLLAETSTAKQAGGAFDLIVVVTASQDNQIARLVRTRRMSREDAIARINAQAGSEERLAIADIVIDNDGDLVSLEQQVDDAWLRVNERLARASRG